MARALILFFLNLLAAHSAFGSSDWICFNNIEEASALSREQWAQELHRRVTAQQGLETLAINPDDGRIGKLNWDAFEAELALVSLGILKETKVVRARHLQVNPRVHFAIPYYFMLAPGQPVTADQKRELEDRYELYSRAHAIVRIPDDTGFNIDGYLRDEPVNSRLTTYGPNLPRTKELAQKYEPELWDQMVALIRDRLMLKITRELGSEDKPKDEIDQVFEKILKPFSQFDDRLEPAAVRTFVEKSSDLFPEDDDIFGFSFHRPNSVSDREDLLAPFRMIDRLSPLSTFQPIRGMRSRADRMNALYELLQGIDPHSYETLRRNDPAAYKRIQKEIVSQYAQSRTLWRGRKPEVSNKIKEILYDISEATDDPDWENYK